MTRQRTGLCTGEKIRALTDSTFRVGTYDPKSLIPKGFFHSPSATTSKPACFDAVPEEPPRPALERENPRERELGEPLAAIFGIGPCITDLQVVPADKGEAPVAWREVRVMHHPARSIDAYGSAVGPREKTKKMQCCAKEKFESHSHTRASEGPRPPY